MREDCRFRGDDRWCEMMFHEPKDLERMCPICIEYEPKTETVMSWIEGLTHDDWREYHSDSEVQNIAKFALKLLTEQTNEIDEISDEYIDLGKEMAKQPKVVRCKDCKYWEHTPENATSYWKPCDEIKTEPHYYCWCGEWKE